MGKPAPVQANSQPNPLRVLLVVTGLQVGGAERQVVLLARGLARRGHAVHVASLIPPTAYGDDLAAAGVGITSLKMRRGVPDPRGLGLLVRFVRTWRPTVAHSHLVHANLLARAACRGTGTPLVCTRHNIYEGAAWRQAAYRVTDRWCAVTTDICKAAAASRVIRKAAPANRTAIIPNGIDPADLAAKPGDGERLRESLDVGDRFTWLFAGRLHRQKDLPNLLRAFESLEDGMLLVAGDGPERASLERQARPMGDRVRFLGKRSDVPALMGAADGFVMSSAWEGLPVVLLEAQWMALPCVCTDVGGVIEALDPPHSGRLVRPGDPIALRRAMQDIMTRSADERRQMGMAGRAHIERNFLIDPVVEQYIALYRSILA